MNLQSVLRSSIMIILVILLQICCATSLDGINLRFSKREADYTLDDSFWNEESPVGNFEKLSEPLNQMRNNENPIHAGEVERLLKEYRQNQELVRKIGGHFYQIIYPVQLRHHEKMGISTREVGGSKVWTSLGKNRRYIMNSTGTNSGYSGRGRTRTGKHFHRTSLLIKAFNHKFRLDLELNTQLLAPNIQQKHILPSGYPQESHREIEHCYYHGTVKDYPGATAAFHTCNGVSGVIHVGNETFVIHPFYGGDLSKHPHVIFEARTKQNKGCANSGNLEWRIPRRQQHFTGFMDKPDRNGAGRYKRDVRDATKYIETAIIIDKAMFDKRNGSTRAEVVHDAIQVANIADLYFRTLNTRVSVVYIETWQGQNQAQIDGSKDISKAVSNFNDYTTRKLHNIDKDTTQLLTGEMFVGGEAGMSVPETVCTSKAVGISVDINTYEPHLLAGTMAHMIGHNIGMGHDDNREECFCRDWHGCIMAQSIVGLENVQPYKFSECSRSDYIDALRLGHGLCLLNKPNEVELGNRRNCGNGIIEDGEDCDCGSIDCSKRDPCCDPITCKLIKEAECASGPCCDNCQLRQAGFVCRDAYNECDLPEVCTGESGQCPPDVFKKNGSPCGYGALGALESATGYCFNGGCPTLNNQCERVWGYGGGSADKQCFEQFNSKGSMNGHCGMDQTNHYIKCDPENVQCGSLQCKEGDSIPIVEGLDQQLYSRTIISIRGAEYECKSISGSVEGQDLPEHGLVKDGTPCGENLVCVNQTCVSIFPYIDTTKCPVNHNNVECSGNGACTNTNKCHCNFGWIGNDCSTPSYATTTIPSLTTVASGEIKMERKETPYAANNTDKFSTLSMVIILVVVVSGFFIFFTLIAVCYRRKTTRLKYDPPYVKKPMAKYVTTANANHHSIEEMSLDGSNKLMFNNQNQFGGQKHQIRRMTASGAEDEQMHSVGANAVSDVERTLKSLNGYHEDILEALRNAASSSHRSTGNTPSGSISEEILRKTLQECAAGSLNYRGSSKNSSRENICENNSQLNAILNDGAGALLHHHRSQQQLHQPQLQQVPPQAQQQQSQQQLNADDEVGPLRIRNLEDLIRQLEHHSSRHMSPSGSEDINNSYGMSETEAERHYRLESSAACSESSHGSRCRQRSSDDENRFMSYGRYPRQAATNRHQHHQPNSPHSFNHIHHSHAHLSSHGHSSHHSSHTHLHQDEEGIYESADPRERNAIDMRDANDSESDDFIQAQQRLARWASEDVVSVVVMESDSSAAVQSPVVVAQNNTNNILPHTNNLQMVHPHQQPMGMNGLGVTASRIDYYQSPPSTTETESSGSVMATQRQQRGLIVDGNVGPQENTGRYPEYKH